jgi:hypothetical protein
MGLLDFIKRIYTKTSDKLSFLNIPDGKAIVAKLDYIKGPKGEKILRRVHLVVPNDVVLKQGDVYRDKNGKEHIHIGKNKYMRIWPNRTEIYDFQNVSACMDLIKRLGSKWDPETARYDHGVVDFSKAGFISKPIRILRLTTEKERRTSIHKTTKDRNIEQKLLRRAIQSVAMAQGLDRVYFGKGTPKSLRQVYIGKDEKRYKGRTFVRVYNAYLPKTSLKLRSKAFKKKVAENLSNDRIHLLRTMKRLLTMNDKLYRVKGRIEIAEVSHPVKTNRIAVAYVLPTPKKAIAKKQVSLPRKKLARK